MALCQIAILYPQRSLRVRGAVIRREDLDPLLHLADELATPDGQRVRIVYGCDCSELLVTLGETALQQLLAEADRAYDRAMGSTA